MAEQGTWRSRLLPHTALLGHGYFRSYLFKMRKVRNPTCLYCGTEKDDKEHTFFGCDRENWAFVSKFAEVIIKNQDILRTKKANLVNETTSEDPPGLHP